MAFKITFEVHPYILAIYYILVEIIGVRIRSTFSVLRPLSYLRLFLYFDLFCTSTALLRPIYFDILSNLDFSLVEKYSFGQRNFGQIFRNLIIFVKIIETRRFQNKVFIPHQLANSWQLGNVRLLVYL